MTALPPTVFLGDYAEALARLAPKGPEAEHTRREIARLLGFEWNETKPAAPTREDKAAAPIPKASPQTRPAPSKSPAPFKSTRDAPEEVKWIPSSLETEGAVAVLPKWEEVFPNLPPTIPDNPTAISNVAEPLFEARWTRGILMAMLATSREGEIDFARLVENMGQARPLPRLPRLPWPTLRRGVQILVDVGTAMTPFVQDQQWLMAEIRKVVGEERTTVRHFTGSPLRGSGDKCWTPPPTGTPVLLLSALGFAPGASAPERVAESEWLLFADRLKRSGCPFVTLTPGSPLRIPLALRRACFVVPWDKRTSSSTLRRLIGKAHRVD